MRLRVECHAPHPPSREGHVLPGRATGSVRVWLNARLCVVGRIVQFGVPRLRVKVPWLPSGILVVGKRYRMEAAPVGGRPLSCDVTVCHADARGIELTIDAGAPVRAAA